MTGAKAKVAMAGLGIALLAVAAVLLPGLQAGHYAGASTTQAATTASSSTCGSSLETYGNITLSASPCTAYGFPSPILKNATLDSKPVQAFIKSAYDYHLVYFGTSKTNSGVMYAVLNVTGRQVVTGNWTAGYTVSYVGDALVNATVLRVTPSVFDITHVSAFALPERNATVAYSPQQDEAIQVALANSSVRSEMVSPPYYVELAAGDSQYYIVQFYQVNGTGVVGAFLNTGITTVTKTFSEQNISGECAADGLVITDPWYAASYAVCKG